MNVDWQKVRCRLRSPGRAHILVLASMAASLLAYVLAHPPVRGAIWEYRSVRPLWTVSAHFEEALSSGRFISTVLAIGLIVVVLLAASTIAKRCAETHYELPLIFGLTALGLIVVPAAALGGLAFWIHVPLLRPPVGLLLVAAIPVLIVAWTAWREGATLGLGRRDCSLTALGPTPSNLATVVGGAAGFVLLTSISTAIVHPPHGYDGLTIHAPLSLLLWRQGDLGTFLEFVPDYSLSHPGTANLVYGLLGIVGGESTANLGQLPFALLGAAAVAAFARRLRLPPRAAQFAAMCFLAAPIVAVQSGMQLTDVAGAAVLMVTLALSCEHWGCWTARRPAFVGLGIGLVATTKLALLPAVAPLAIFALAGTVWRVSQRGYGRSEMAQVCLLLVVPVIVVAPWWARNIAVYGNPIYPADIPFIGGGHGEAVRSKKDAEFVPRRAAWLVYPLIESTSEYAGFGALVPVGVLPGFVLAATRRSLRRPWVLYLLVAAFMLPSWWMLTRHEPRFLLALVGLGSHP